MVPRGRCGLEAEAQGRGDGARRAARIELGELVPHLADILFIEQVGDIQLKVYGAAAFQRRAVAGRDIHRRVGRQIEVGVGRVTRGLAVVLGRDAGPEGVVIVVRALRQQLGGRAGDVATLGHRQVCAGVGRAAQLHRSCIDDGVAPRHRRGGGDHRVDRVRIRGERGNGARLQDEGTAFGCVSPIRRS